MTLVLVANIVLSASVLAAVLGLSAWAITRSHHEGRPVTVASRRHWARHTISLRRGSTPARRQPAPPFAS